MTTNKDLDGIAEKLFSDHNCLMNIENFGNYSLERVVTKDNFRKAIQEALSSSKGYTESIEFIQWVMAKTDWRHDNDEATEWTDGVAVITTEQLLEQYRKGKDNV